ncbi:LLM class flavin-dependent oxidoreductase [Nocardia sp. NPDC004722]
MTEFVWRLPTRPDGRRAEPTLRGRGACSAPITAADLITADRADLAESRAGDRYAVTDVRAGRFGPFEHLHEIVNAAELSGLDGVLAPYDPGGEESWIVGGGALRATRHTRVIIEFPPNFGTPVYAAKVSATLQRHSAGRLGWRLAVETDQQDARRRGDRIDGDARYTRAAEFLTVARGVWNEQPVAPAGFAGTGFDYEGQYYEVSNGGFRGILSGLPFPTVYLSGDSEAALQLSARHGDVHVFTEQPDGLDAPLARLREAAAAAGRTVRAGLEVPVIARETAAEAWRRVERQWRELYPDGPDPHSLNLGDGRWAGFTHLGYPQPIGLVGSYDQVAQRLRTYVELGVDTVVLSGHPHLEELYRAGEHLLFRVDPTGRTLQETTA